MREHAALTPDPDDLTGRLAALAERVHAVPRHSLAHVESAVNRLERIVARSTSPHGQTTDRERDR